MLLAEVRKAIRAAGLLAPGTHILAGVSGGADSVALLLALCQVARERGLRLTAAHLNHGLRGRAADEDEAFVVELAARRGVEIVCGRSEVRRRAKRKQLSLEMAAREARYAFFKRAARQAGATVVATAHTADDQAETVLLNLIRGAGPDGLSGIPQHRRLAGVHMIRPLLHVTRQAVEAFLLRNRQPWRDDATNLDPVFLRNRVRHELMPLLQGRFNPAIRDALCRTAEICDVENQWLNALTQELLPDAAARRRELTVDRVRDQPAAARRRVLRRWLAAAGVPVDALSFETIRSADRLLCQSRGSGRLDLPDGKLVRRDYARLVLTGQAEETSPPCIRQRIRLSGVTELSRPSVRITTWVAPGLIKERPRGPGSLPARASISRAAVGRHAVFVRTWRPGDRMAPLGMRGSRKLQDIFVDAKVPARRRSQIPLVECAGEIIWIPGYRIARGWEITDSSLPALQVRVDPVV